LRENLAPRQAATYKQTALQTTKLINSVLLLKVSDLGIHRTRPKSTYFKPNYGRWARLDISKGTEATALSSKPTRLHLGPLHAIGKCSLRPQPQNFSTCAAKEDPAAPSVRSRSKKNRDPAAEDKDINLKPSTRSGNSPPP
jgi:hypothetical protein